MKNYSQMTEREQIERLERCLPIIERRGDAATAERYRKQINRYYGNENGSTDF